MHPEVEPLFRTTLQRDTNNRKDGLPAALHTDGTSSGMLCSSGEALEKLFPVLPTGSIHFVSANDWSICELLLHFLNLTGPADVYFTTWSLKEFGVRQLLSAMDSGAIRTLHALLDSRVKSRNPDVYFLAERNFATVRLAECHAKVCVIRSEKYSISIVGSANFTNNPRIEAGVVCSYPPVAEFHCKWITDVIQNAHPFRNGSK